MQTFNTFYTEHIQKLWAKHKLNLQGQNTLLSKQIMGFMQIYVFCAFYSKTIANLCILCIIYTEKYYFL